ncbi:hypothetical protein C479_12878 [Halovivax asiaticus JCM 14624]|uniref:Uncharacterized protein n=1 Tax=Halovivax asiaticus JCM 14624 TaxID=1227490 RepID=M0BBN5_9EURY|nr:hypothetical protein [Halovivax asiaticus]ELZ08235.1 hypothetical protein C479_12878 [Halovivax asiaticus JCM 14624]
MGLLDRLRSDPDTAKFDRIEEDVTYTVSPRSHTVAYAIAVSRAEHEALADLVRADDEAPDHEETLSTALSAALDGEDADTDVIVDRIRRPRRVADAVTTSWDELLADDPDVAYLPVGMIGELAAFVATCRERDDNDDDSFTLPNTFDRAASLLVRIKEATDRPENRIVVHRDRVPTVEAAQRASENPPSDDEAQATAADAESDEAAQSTSASEASDESS